MASVALSPTLPDRSLGTPLDERPRRPRRLAIDATLADGGDTTEYQSRSPGLNGPGSGFARLATGAGSAATGPLGSTRK
jgi:hypothetical protein